MEKVNGIAQPNGEKLFNFRPLLFVAVFMAMGVVFSFFHIFQDFSGVWLIALLPLAAVPALFSFPLYRWRTILLAIVLLCFSFFVGAFGFGMRIDRYADVTAKGECDFSGRVVEIWEGSETVGVVLDDITIEGKPHKYKLIAYLPASFSEKLQLSDELFIHGNIQKRNYDADEFSVQAKNFGREIFLTASVEEVERSGHHFDLFLFLNARAKAVIDEGMDEMPAAVTKAVLLGDTSGIEEGLYENIRRGGIAHIFAVSGLHVGALFGVCLLALKKTPLRRLSAWVHFTLMISILFIYAGICAFSPSVVRATVICIVAYLGVLLQVKTDFLQSLGVAAASIMLFDPSTLFTVGFQLSFAACFGIALLSKPIGQVFDELAKLYRKRFPKPLTEAEVEAIKNGDTLPPSIPARIYRACASFLATSIAAQIFTAPLLLIYFGYISGWALLLNCFFVPFIGVIFSLLLLLVGVACVLPMFTKVFLYLPNLIWSAVLLLFELADFTKFSIEGISISAPLVALYLTSTLFFTDKWNIKKSVRWILGGVCIFAFGVGMVALNV